MSLRHLINLAFEEGCGMTWDQVMQDPGYHDLMLYYAQNMFMDPARTPYRVTPQDFAMAGQVYLAKNGEEELCVIQTKEAPWSGRYFHRLALLDFLGQQLVISTASNVLSPKMIALAEKIRSRKRASVKYRLLRKFYLLVRAEVEQTKAEHLPDFKIVDAATSLAYWFDQLKRPVDYRNVLPLQYGRFKSGSIRPACLGMATIVTTFARLAGLRCYVGHIVQGNYNAYWHHLQVASTKMLADMKDREPDRRVPFQNRIQRLHDWARVRNAVEMTDFHPVVVIEYDDRRRLWMLMDPYLVTCGQLPSNWNINGAVSVLDGFSSAAPGITAICNDGNRLNSYYRKISWILAKAAIQHSRSLEEKLKQVMFGDIDLVEWLGQQEEILFLRRLIIPGIKWKEATPQNLAVFKMPMLLDYLQQPGLVACYEMFGWEGKYRIRRDALKRRLNQFYQDPVYRRDCLLRLLYSFHRRIIRQIQIIESGTWAESRMLHSVLELAHPEMAIALHVLNNLACHVGPDKVDTSELTLYTSSQFIWHDAATLDVDVRTRGRRASVEWTETMLRSLDKRLLHPAVVKKLEAIVARFVQRDEVADLLRYIASKGGEITIGLDSSASSGNPPQGQGFQPEHPGAPERAT